MVKMRTESVNCGGGAAARQPVMMVKSQQDVDAAVAIAQLSDAPVRHVPPPDTDCHVRTGPDCELLNGHDSTPTKNSSSLTRFSHIRTAVMPHAHSRVEKVLKRKRDETEPVATDSRSQGRRDVVDRVRRAIETERDSFLMAKRHLETSSQRHEGQASEQELVGRFVRTCKPSRREEAVVNRPYVTVSHQVVSPTLVTSSPGLFPSSCRKEIAGQTVGKPWVPAHVSRDHLHVFPLASPPHRIRVPQDHRERCVLEGSSSMRRVVHHQDVHPGSHLAAVSNHDIAVQYHQRSGTYRSSPQQAQLYKGSPDLRRPVSSVNAYYNLGQSAAAAAASQFFLLQPRPVQPSHTSVSNSVHLPVDYMSKTSAASVQSRPASSVDSGTLKKVRRGEFGSLSTLRVYCEQLRRRSAPSGSVDRSSQTQSADDEVAVDLTVRKRRRGSGSEVDAGGCVRPSRSCGSSPASTLQQSADVHLLAQSSAADHRYRHHSQSSSVSLPCSPYTGSLEDARLSQWQNRTHVNIADTEMTSNDSTESSPAVATDVIPDSRLPLKKRRLLYHQQQSMPTVVEEDGEQHGRTLDEPTQAIRQDVSATYDDLLSNAKCLEYFRAAILSPDEDGDLPLHIAVAKGTAAAVDRIISLMLALGVSLDYRNDRQQTALQLAVLTDQRDMVCQLLASGASPNVVNRHGQTSIHTSVLVDNAECLSLILQHSRHPADINARSYDGLTALHSAVQRGNLPAAKRLLSAGADIDAAETKNGRTALFYAAQRNDVAMMTLLMTSGANTSQATYSGCTPAQAAVAAHSYKCSTDMKLVLQDNNLILPYHQPACCPTG